jgi:hypothetical protein
VFETMVRGGSEAVELLVGVAEAAADDVEAGYVGAGGIETLIHFHGDDVVELLDEAARMNWRLRVALRSATLSGSLSDAGLARLSKYLER